MSRGISRSSLALQIIVVIIVAYLAASGLKLLFGVPRPCELLETCPESFSFPSRHTTIAFALATLVSFRISNRVVQALAFVLAGAVGYWRIFSGVHTIHDVIGGVIVGVIIGMLVYNIFKNHNHTKSRPWWHSW
jgi:membrane-associated phospholipid phosphatase